MIMPPVPPPPGAGGTASEQAPRPKAAMATTKIRKRDALIKSVIAQETAAVNRTVQS
jgi:hypothetical protein